MTLKELLTWHLANKKSLQVQDVYKLFYQGVHGPAHMLKNLNSAEQYLYSEYRNVGESTHEFLLDPVSLDGSVVRVNLRPYKAQRGNIKKLFKVLHLSAQQIRGENEEFVAVWDQFVPLVKAGQLQFPLHEVKIFDEQLRTHGPRTVHHSPEYREANKPAYRVVMREVYRSLIDIT